MSADPILSTLSDLVSLYDGIAEAEDEHVMTVLLPAPIANQLNLPETATIATQANIPDSIFVTYHSEVVQQFTELVGRRGTVSAIAIQYEGYLKTTGFEKQLQQFLRPQNGLIRLIEATPKPTRYLWCHVDYTAEADERRIGMVSFIVNETTQVTPVDLGDALFWKSDQVPVEQPEALSAPFLEALSPLLERIAAQQVQANLANWRMKLERAKARDEDRLKTYYGTMGEEIQRKMRSRQLAGDDASRELARLSATQQELDRKLADLEERYALKVNASLYSVLVIEVPTVHLHCELVRKKIKRPITAVWNPFTKIIEPLRCEKTGVPVEEFYLDDTAAQIIATEAWGQKG
ncbi:MAG: hypothetical protein MUF49_17340 [Oculatellaceae cyanobacterium Prado106]|jgi:hypothetical protein|nr:hypothetical protein [Oculatellaceae cyanobacterium Prado106]